MTVPSRPDIGIVISDLDHGGAQRVVCLLAQYWLAEGKRVCVMTQSDRESDLFVLPDRAERVVIGGLGPGGSLLGRVLKNLLRLWLIRRAVSRVSPRTLFVFVGRTVVQTILATRGLDIWLVACERNDPSRQSLGAVWDWLRRRTYKLANVVTANSESGLSAMRAFVPESKLVLVSNPLPQRDSRAPNDRKRFLAIGRLTAQKGFDLLLRAFAEIAAELPEWSVVLVGDGEERESLTALCRELGVEDRVYFAGRTSSVEEWYRAGGVFVLPSRHEGRPNAMLEAMSAGLPVIVSDASSGPLEILGGGEAGLVVATENVHALADAMRRVASDPRTRERFSDASFNRMGELQPQSVFVEWDALTRD